MPVPRNAQLCATGKRTLALGESLRLFRKYFKASAFLGTDWQVHC